jgi:recombination protein RecA
MSDLSDYLKKKYKDTVKVGDDFPPIKRISTGILGLDIILGGGLPLGRIGEIFGIESGGKTATSLALIKAAQLQGIEPVFIDMERTLDPDQVNRTGIDNELFHRAFPNYGEEAIDLGLEAATAGSKLIIIDSVPGLTPKSTEEKVEKDSEARSMGAVAGLLTRLMGKIIKGVETSECSWIFLNQVRDKMNSPYGGVHTPGGHAKDHMCSWRLQITHAIQEKDKEGVIISYIKGLKNKTAPAGLTGELVIEKGIVNAAASLVDGAIRARLLEKAGSWIKFSNEVVEEFSLPKANLAQGSVKAGAELLANPELYKILYNRSLIASGVLPDRIPDYWKLTNE